MPHTTARLAGSGSSPHWPRASAAAEMASAWDLSSRRTSTGVRSAPGSKPLTRHTSAAAPCGSRSSSNTSADGRPAHRFSHSSPASFPAGVFTPAPTTATGTRLGRIRAGTVTASPLLDGPVTGDFQLRMKLHGIDQGPEPGSEEPQPGPWPAEPLPGQRAGQRGRGRLQHVAGESGETLAGHENGKDVLQRHVVAGNRRADLEGR